MIKQTSQMLIDVNLWQKSLVRMLYGPHNAEAMWKPVDSF